MELPVIGKEIEDGQNFYDILKKKHELREIIARIDQNDESYEAIDDEGFKRPKVVKLREKVLPRSDEEIYETQKKETLTQDFRVSLPLFSPLLKMSEKLAQTGVIIKKVPEIVEKINSTIVNLNSRQFKSSFKLDSDIIKQPLERRIGTLTISERKKLLAKYLEKRKRKKLGKKIEYECRKRVAENRLRFKGRFITKEQAKALLVISSKNEICIKQQPKWKVESLVDKASGPANAGNPETKFRKIEIDDVSTAHYESNDPNK